MQNSMNNGGAVKTAPFFMQKTENFLQLAKISSKIYRKCYNRIALLYKHIFVKWRFV